MQQMECTRTETEICVVFLTVAQWRPLSSWKGKRLSSTPHPLDREDADTADTPMAPPMSHQVNRSSLDDPLVLLECSVLDNLQKLNIH